MFEVKIEGLAELGQHLRNLPQALRHEKLLAALRVAAEPMRDRMAQLAPRSDEPHPHMADGMVVGEAKRVGNVMGGQWEATDEYQAAVAVGPRGKFFYAIFQEYGTVKQDGKPFMRPAFDGESPGALTILKWELWKQIVAGNGPGSAPGRVPRAGGGPTGGSGGLL